MSLPDKHQESSPSRRRAKIRTLLQNYEAIPTVPSMVDTITALTADVNCSLAALEAAIKTDQSCVARLLQVGNSAFYASGANRTVTSVRRAILMFGFNAVQNITLNLTMAILSNCICVSLRLYCIYRLPSRRLNLLAPRI